MVDWEKVRKIHITLLDYVDQHIADTAGLSKSSAQAKQSLRARIKVTEVYAKIVDEKKIEAMNLVNNIFA